MRKKIKIDFSDWWPGFDKTNNYFYNLLKDEFEIEISNRPDYLFFSVFGNNHQNYKCKKIFYTGENIAPPLGYCDWSFSFDQLDDPRNYRLPHYLLYDGYYELVKEKHIEDKMSNRNFCSFVVSNGNCRDRNVFFEKLSKYKKIHSGGGYLNNIGYQIKDKLEFLKIYKFNICFENDAHRGYNEHYTTEKLMQSMQANTIGIYYGNTRIEREFNKKSFINVRDFSNFDEAIEFIIELDQDNNRYLEMLKESPLIDNVIPDNNKEENIRSFLYKIFK